MADPTHTPKIPETETFAESVAVILAQRRGYVWAKLHESETTAVEPVSRATFREDALALLGAVRELPAGRRTSPVNDICLRMFGRGGERMKDFRVYEEGGSVLVCVECEATRDLLQYLSPEDAMAFAKAFERCAIAALKNRS